MSEKDQNMIAKSPWYRIRLKTIFLGGFFGVLILVLAFAFLFPNKQRQAIAAIEAEGGLLSYNSQAEDRNIFIRVFQHLSNSYSPEVSNVVIASDESIKYMAAFPEVTELGLHGMKISDQALQSLKNYPQIKTLRLHDTAITGSSLAELKMLPNLQSLEIRQSAISKELIDALNAVAPKIEILDPSFAPMMAEKNISEKKSSLFYRWKISIVAINISEDTLMRFKELPVDYLCIFSSHCQVSIATLEA
jgi:hypothetical protein